MKPLSIPWFVLYGVVFVLLCFACAACGLLGVSGSGAEQAGAEAGRHAARAAGDALQGDWMGTAAEVAAAVAAVCGIGYGGHRYTVRRAAREVNEQRNAARKARGEAV